MRQAPKGSSSFGPAGPGLKVQDHSTAVLDNVKLWGKEAGTFKASTLWKSSPIMRFCSTHLVLAGWHLQSLHAVEVKPCGACPAPTTRLW
eukprot:1162072-Pelagomonas_calceolata.AAC.1